MEDSDRASAGKGKKPLRRGWTTGACATAATKAAYIALLSGRFEDPVSIRLPRGEEPSFFLVEAALDQDSAVAAVEKDAGDDPDVTHGAVIRAHVRRGRPGSGIVFFAGPGVGMVTLPGLPIPVGEPAINPAPRRLIGEHVAAVARAFDDGGDLEVTIAVPGGEVLAQRTANGRLGIVGGLSILGTTGVVIPYSCSAWIASIQRGIDVARAAGCGHVAAATGSTSERAVQAYHHLPDLALIEMGDFVGGTLKYLARHPVPRLSLAGGFAKIAKLAAGHLNLHSKRSAVDFNGLAAAMEALGADGALIEETRRSAMASRVLQLAQEHGISLADHLAAQARDVALDKVDRKVAVEVLVFDRPGALVGHAVGW